MSNIIYSLFGSYSPVTYTFVEKVWDPVNEAFVDVVSDVVAPGLAGVDWPWLAGVALFAIVLYSVFRLIGGVLCGK